MPLRFRSIVSFLRVWCLLAGVLLAAAPAARAQMPNWQLVRRIGLNDSRTYSDISLRATVADAQGNLYLVGGFQGTVDFDATTLTSSGLQDVFLAKWNLSTQRFVWAQQLGGAADEYATTLAVSGNALYIGGRFTGVGKIGTTTMTATYSDGFVAKLTETGNVATLNWVQQLGGDGFDSISKIAVNGSNVYVAGQFDGLATTLGSLRLTNLGANVTYDGFLWKLTDTGTAGSPTWGQNIGAINNDLVTDLVVVGANVYVSGSTYGYLHLGPTLIATSTVTAGGLMPATNMFVGRLTDAGSTGNFVWGKVAGGAQSDAARGLAVSGSNIYVVGSFYESVATFGTLTLTSSGTRDAFITKLTETGADATFTWAQRVGGNLEDEASAVVVNGADVYVTGTFQSSSVVLGSNTFTNAFYGGAFRYNIFAAKLTDAGATSTYAWALAALPAAYITPATVAFSNGIFYIGGTGTSGSVFGSQQLISPGGGTCQFFAAIADRALLATTSAKLDPNLRVFPNPATGSTTVQLPAIAGVDHVALVLSDALGRTVSTTKLALPAVGLSYQLPLAGLARGVYALQLTAGDNRVVRRLVVE